MLFSVSFGDSRRSDSVIQRPRSAVSSTGRCNTCIKSLCWCLLWRKRALRIESRYIDICTHLNFSPIQASQTALNNLVPIKNNRHPEGQRLLFAMRVPGSCGQKSGSLRPITIPPRRGGDLSVPGDPVNPAPRFPTSG